jgi:hypothetical protein
MPNKPLACLTPTTTTSFSQRSAEHVLRNTPQQPCDPGHMNVETHHVAQSTSVSNINIVVAYSNWI